MAKEKTTKEKISKTNAIRLLDSKNIKYILIEYEAPNGFMSGIEVARATGMPTEKVFKTLVTIGASKEHYVCVIPVAEELNLKKAAKHFNEKKTGNVAIKRAHGFDRICQRRMFTCGNEKAIENCD